MVTTDKRKKQLSVALDRFYQNPVAKVSLELFLTIGLVVFLAMAAIRPTLLEMTELIKRIEDKKELSEQLSKKVAALGTAQTQFLALQERLFMLDQAVPSTADVIEALKIIEKSASDTGIILNSASIQEVPDKGVDQQNNFDSLSKKDMQLVVSMSGDYSSIRDFVSALQNSRRTFVIDTVVFSVSQDKGSKQLRANLTLKAPYFGKGSSAQK